MVWLLHPTGLRSLPETQSEDLWVGGLWAAAAAARPLVRSPGGRGGLAGCCPSPLGASQGPALGLLTGSLLTWTWC